VGVSKKNRTDRERIFIVFQQIENPAEVLLTAHWDSVAQHMQWIGSRENQEVYPVIQGHLDMSKLVFFHVSNVAAFSPEVLGASVVGVLRYFVPRTRREVVELAMAETKVGAYSGIAGRGGWRIEKDGNMEQDQLDEYVLVVGSKSVEELQSFKSKFDEHFQECGSEEKRYARVRNLGH
jgi:hypothetical protein